MKKFFGIILAFILLLGIISPCLADEAIIKKDGSLNMPTKKSFLDFFKKKKDKIKQTVQPEQNKGYYGILPDIEKDFEYKRETIQRIAPKQYSEKEIKDGFLLDAPLDDPLFLDVIIKKDKTSDYVNELMKIKRTLEKLRQCIVDNSSIQFFNANVNVLDLQTKNLEKKFELSAYSQTPSYFAVRHVNYSAKLLGNLKYDANFYSRYMPTQEGEYSKENINNRSLELLNEIEQTIFEIGNAE